jgi:hypothetical protein
MTYDWPGRAAIAAEARRRSRGWSLVTWGAFVLILPAVDQIFDDDDSPLTVGRYFIGVLIGAVVFGVILLIMRRFERGNPLALGPPIELGLTADQRREVGRAVRSGTPSIDPTLACVEYESAHRTAREARRSLPLFAVLAVVAVVVALFGTDNLTEQFAYGAAAVVFALRFVQEARGARNARRYLAATAHSRD